MEFFEPQLNQRPNIDQDYDDDELTTSEAVVREQILRALPLRLTEGRDDMLEALSNTDFNQKVFESLSSEDQSIIKGYIKKILYLLKEKNAGHIPMKHPENTAYFDSLTDSLSRLKEACSNIPQLNYLLPDIEALEPKMRQ